ncbi:MAG: cytochrome c-type biogenesis protein [Burkholderiales bacterium]
MRFFVILLLLSGAAWGENPDLEKRVQSLAQELRCLVCQNQTLADSNAPLAVDLRNQVREQLAAGKSEQDVIDFMVARYGDFVLYRPPLKPSTVLLWAGPFLFLVLGVWLLVGRVKKQSSAGPPLSEADRERAAKLLE